MGDDKGAETRELTRVSDLIIKEDFVRGVVAKSKGRTEEIEAGVVIGADGFYSFVARRLGLLQIKLDRIAAQYSFHMAMPEKEIDEKIGGCLRELLWNDRIPCEHVDIAKA